MALRTRNGGLMFMSITHYWPSFMASVLTFPTERGVFLKEHSAGLYGVFAYYFSRSLLD